MRVFRWPAVVRIVMSLLALRSSLAFAQQPESLVLSPDQAVAFALERSLVLKAARLDPQIASLGVSAAEAAWSPQFSARSYAGEDRTRALTAFDPLTGLFRRQFTSQVAMGQLLPWGASYSVEWNAARLSSNSPILLLNPQRTTSATVSFTQRLLRGFHIDEARANRLVRLKSKTISEAGLESSVAATTRAVLQAYWNWIYLREYLAVEKQSLALAQNLLRDDRQRAAVGKIAAVDVVEAEAEVARRSDVILSAAKDVANAEDQLRSLIFAPGDDEMSRSLVPPPDLRDPDLVIEPPVEAIAHAIRLRQDLRILRAALDIDEITIKRLNNERLPDASLQMSYTGQGVGGSAVSPSVGVPPAATGGLPIGTALDDLVRFRYPGWSVGLAVSVPLGKSRAAAEAAQATVKRQQDETMLRNAQQQVATEVKAAIRSADANRQRLSLTATAVSLAERRLEGEERKLAVGLATSFFVFQAQRDLAIARERKLLAILAYRLSLADVRAVQTIPVLQ